MPWLLCEDDGVRCNLIVHNSCMVHNWSSVPRSMDVSWTDHTHTGSLACSICFQIRRIFLSRSAG